MNAKKIVKLSNTIGIVSIILLIYWVFIFVSIEVFGFKIFKENITQTFYLSIIGILALMFGSLMVNIMFNLTRIAQKHNNDEVIEVKSSKIWLLFLISFPLIFGLLFAGDIITSNVKEKMLVEAAKSIIESNPETLKALSNYSFNQNWINEAALTLKLLSKTDTNYRSVLLIIKDTIGESPVYLRFSDYDYYNINNNRTLHKIDFVFKTTLKNRKYLDKVFNEKYIEKSFSAYDGSYELFYPLQINDIIIVLYFTDSQNYGKLGS